MSIKLAVVGRPPIVLDDENISLGSDPGCSVSFPDLSDVKPKHAIIRMIAGRWLIEVRQAESVFIGGTEPKRMHWLSPGDVIHLTENGPSVTFQPKTDEPATDDSAPFKLSEVPLVEKVERPASEQRARKSDVVLLPDSDPIIPLAEPVTPTKPAASVKQKTKPPSSSIIPTLKTPSAATPGAPKAPSSTTVRTVKPPSSAIIPTLKSPAAGSPDAPKSPSSTTIPTSKPPASKTVRTSQPPSSTTIKTQGSASSDSIPAAKKTQPPLSRTDASSPAAKAKRPKTGELPIFGSSDSDEGDAKVPVLKRLSSWEMPVADKAEEEASEGAWSGGRRRKGKFSQDADVKYIKKVVISCAAIALGILILWHSYRELKRALNGPGYGVPSTSILLPERFNDSGTES